MKAHLLYVEDDESLSFVTKDNCLARNRPSSWFQGLYAMADALSEDARIESTAPLLVPSALHVTRLERERNESPVALRFGITNRFCD